MFFNGRIFLRISSNPSLKICLVKNFTLLPISGMKGGADFYRRISLYNFFDSRNFIRLFPVAIFGIFLYKIVGRK